MKKALLSFILCAGVLGAAMAQGDGITTKRDKGKGYTILPEAGDWGIGFDASPFFKPFFNMFNNTVNQDVPKLGWGQPMKIYGHMVVDDETYYTGAVRIGFQSHTFNIPAGTNTDKLSYSAFDIGLSAGIEKMKSIRHRLQGFYGAGVSIDLTSFPEHNVTIGAAPPFTVRGNVTYTNAANAAAGYKQTGGGTFAFGVGAFVGARYFFAPKISIGAKYGWGIAIASTGKRTTTPNTGTATSTGSQFDFKVDTNFDGSLGLEVWF